MLSNSCSPTAGAAKSNVPLETASNGIGINLFAWTGTADGAGEEVGDGRGVTVDIIVAVDVGRIVEGGVALLVGEGVGVWEGTTGVGGGGGWRVGRGDSGGLGQAAMEQVNAGNATFGEEENAGNDDEQGGRTN